MSWRRLPFLLPGAAALLLGLDAGLGLLGLPAAPVSDRLLDVHGFLLVLGFVGTLIALERAVALRAAAGFAAPAFLGIGGLALVSPVPLVWGRAALVAGTAALALVYARLWRRQRDDAVLVQGLGAVMALGAAVLWLGGTPVPRVLPWLVAFVVLTIVGERLELARLDIAGPGPAQLVALGACVVMATTAAHVWPAVGYAALGLALLALVGWLATNDVARRTVRADRLPRFVAVCLLLGYSWLAVAGAVWVLAGQALEGAPYDAVVHAVLRGFTLSAIMAHGPVIHPAVLQVRLPYHPAMYAPVLLLHASLVVRLVLGDARGLDPARQAGGVLNVVAVLCFVAVLAWSAGPRRASGASSGASRPRPARRAPAGALR